MSVPISLPRGFITSHASSVYGYPHIHAILAATAIPPTLRETSPDVTGNVFKSTASFLRLSSSSNDATCNAMQQAQQGVCMCGECLHEIRYQAVSSHASLSVTCCHSCLSDDVFNLYIHLLVDCL
jgi:hypothetical protein